MLHFYQLNSFPMIMHILECDHRNLTVGFNLRLLQKLFLRNIGFEIKKKKKKWIFINISITWIKNSLWYVHEHLLTSKIVLWKNSQKLFIYIRITVFGMSCWRYTITKVFMERKNFKENRLWTMCAYNFLFSDFGDVEFFGIHWIKENSMRFNLAYNFSDIICPLKILIEFMSNWESRLIFWRILELKKVRATKIINNFS